MSRPICVQEAAQRLRQAQRIALLCHISPDGDTLGSAYGLAHALPHAQVDIVCDDTVADWIAFVCEGNLPKSYAEVAESSYDLIVSIDVADNARLGEGAGEWAQSVDIKIDHHSIGKSFAPQELVETQAAACAEIIYRIVQELGTMNVRTANALYAAISSDTGGFRFENTTAQTHLTAAALISAGANHADIDHRLFESRTAGEVAAIKWFWSHLQMHYDGRVAAVALSNEDKDAYGIPEQDISVLASMTRELAGVVLGVVVKQSRRHPEQYKISLRSGVGVAANQICAHFGGGGHLRAAGATLTAQSAQQALQMVLDCAKEQLQ